MILGANRFFSASAIVLLLNLTFIVGSPALAQDPNQAQSQGQAQNQNTAQDQYQNQNQQFNQQQQFNQNQVQGGDPQERVPNGADLPYPAQEMQNADMKNAAPENMQQNTQAPNMPVDQN